MKAGGGIGEGKEHAHEYMGMAPELVRGSAPEGAADSSHGREPVVKSAAREAPEGRKNAARMDDSCSCLRRCVFGEHGDFVDGFWCEGFQKTSCCSQVEFRVAALEAQEERRARS